MKRFCSLCNAWDEEEAMESYTHYTFDECMNLDEELLYRHRESFGCRITPS